MSLQYRTATGAASNYTQGPQQAIPVWVRLGRVGSTFTGSLSINGTTWTTVASQTITMPTIVFVGLAVTSHNVGATTTAIISDVTLGAATPAPTPAPTPTLSPKLLFTPSADDSTNVTSYRVDIFTVGANPSTATPVKTQNVGKPTITNGEMVVDLMPIITSISSGTYFCTVTAIGPGGSTLSAASNTVRLNQRNCGGTEHLSRGLYHSGLTADPLEVMRILAGDDALPRFAFAGYSLGGNIALKLAGELAGDDRRRVVAVAAVSPPIELGVCVDALERRQNVAYHWNVLRGLRGRMRRKAHLFPGAWDIAPLRGIRTVRAFDDAYTAPYHGFAGAADYYHRASALRVEDHRFDSLAFECRFPGVGVQGGALHGAAHRSDCRRLCS